MVDAAIDFLQLNLPVGSRRRGRSLQGSQDFGAHSGLVEEVHLEQRIDVEAKVVDAPDAPRLVLCVHRENGRPDVLARVSVLEARARARNLENAAIRRFAFHGNEVVVGPFDHRQRGRREQM